jgi:ABC-type antimicrobial peptide transport system permease subunit
MYRQYFRQAWCLMKQNRFFSAIYIIGTGLAISMVMVMAVVYHIRTTDIRPETHRDRMYYMDRVSYRYNDNNGSNNGYGLLREVILPMQTPEAVAVATSSFLFYVIGDSFVQIPGGDVSPKVTLKGTNDGFWRVYDFAFMEGKPFTGADFQSGMLRAVVSESVARQLYGRTDIVGQAVLLNEVEYTVSGVVRDVSRLTSDVYADIWVPYTSIPALMPTSTDEKMQVTGFLETGFLLRSPADTAAFRVELESALKRYNTMLTGGQTELDPGQLYGERSLTRLFYADARTTYLILAVLLALFLLVPALNLSGLNASHMQDRIPELGVRKAFGARRGTLFSQIFVENMMLMLPGGVAGLFFSYALIFLLKGMLLDPSARMPGGGGELNVAPGLLLNLEVFGYAFFICLVLNLLSSLIPVWRAVRVSITEALNN